MMWVWLDELLFTSILLGIILGLVLRNVKDETTRFIIELIGWLVQIGITIAAFLLAFQWFWYIIVAVLSCAISYLLVSPLWNWLRLRIVGTEVQPTALPEKTLPTIDETKVIDILEMHLGFGFKAIHARVVRAISMGRTSEKDIAIFLDVDQPTVKSAIEFMKVKELPMFRKGIPDVLKIQFAREIIEEAVNLPSSAVR